MVQHIPGFPRFTLEPGKMGGQACIRQYRFTLSMLLEKIANGLTVPEILEDYPFLEEADITDALRYAAGQAARDFYVAY